MVVCGSLVFLQARHIARLREFAEVLQHIGQQQAMRANMTISKPYAIWVTNWLWKL